MGRYWFDIDTGAIHTERAIVLTINDDDLLEKFFDLSPNERVKLIYGLMDDQRTSEPFQLTTIRIGS